MEVIYKYPLKIKERQEVLMPKGAIIIRAGDVDGEVFLWAIVECQEEGKELQLQPRFIEMYKTGQIFSTPAKVLKYQGFAGLHVGEELGLYIFEILVR